MAKSKEISEDLKELRTQLQAKKVVLGSDRVLKLLKAKEVKKVFLARNATTELRDNINHYANLAGIPVLSLDLDNEELGIFCKKNFFVAVLAII